MNALIKYGIAAASIATFVGAAWAEPASSAPAVEAAAAPAATPGQLLERADAALDSGNSAEALQLYQQVVREHPNTDAARHAARSAKAIEQIRRPAAPPAKPAAQPAAAASATLRLEEPFSSRTGERTNLSIWEQVDFVSSAFGYGLAIGAISHFAFVEPADAQALAFSVLSGAAVYTTGALLYLGFGNVDRADLPLMLSIASYIPTTALLLAAALNADDEVVLPLITYTALGALPIAFVAGQKLELDPGDTQLVRDAGVWGMSLSLLTAAGFFVDDLDSGDMAIVALAGLYGGMGVGLLAARSTELSLERVRVVTIGGYGGAVIGTLFGTLSDGDTAAERGAAIGAAAGLALTMASTAFIDERLTSQGSAGLTPTLVPMRDSAHHTVLGLGFASALP